MQCTAEQIEEKRRQAKERLARKLQSPAKPPQLPNLQVTPSSTSPRFKFNRNKTAGVTPKKCFKPYQKPTDQNIQINQKTFYGKNNSMVTIKLSMVSTQRFVADLDYLQQAIDIFKTIPSRNYCTTTRKWDFSLKDYALLIQKIESCLTNVILEKIPPYVIKSMKKEPQNVNVDWNKLDPELVGALMPFQIEGVRFGIEKNGRCLIADDMGLGKTYQALAIANYYQEDWPLLIVTTASMTTSWQETIHKVLPSISLMYTQYMVSGKDYIGDAKILIVSHDMMSRAIDKLLERNFGVFIIDESHAIKNPKSKCTKAANKLGKKAKRVILLSGTPALSRPCELYSQIALINENFFDNFFEYSKRYCDGKKTQFGWDATGKSNLQELEVLLQKEFMIRRTKNDVLKTLPNKEQEVVELDVNLKQFSKEDRQCLKALAARYNDATQKQEKHMALLQFYNESARIKVPSVCSYVLQMLEQKKKFLIFAHHHVMLDAIEKILIKKNVMHIRIDGSTTPEQRKHFVDKFQLNSECICAVLSITAANAGITLTAAQLVLFAELHWNPTILSQAESRAHRIGQEHPVFVRYLVGTGTADHAIWQMLQEKQKILSDIGLCKDSFENISVKKQEEAVKPLTENLNITSNYTPTKMLDITTYFKTARKSDVSFNENFDDSALLDDGMDDLFCDIDI